MANLYYDRGRYEEAEPLYQRALAISAKALGPEHPQASYAVLGLALLCQAQSRPEEAARFFRLALKIRESTLSPEHPLTVKTRKAYDDFLKEA